jgi:hypothetical protein
MVNGSFGIHGRGIGAAIVDNRSRNEYDYPGMRLTMVAISMFGNGICGRSAG